MEQISEKIKEWKREEDAAFIGWDFSRLKGRWECQELSWDYRKIVEEYLQENMSLLDLGTGGGEFLLSLRHPYGKTAVTEGYMKNFKLCREKLSPLGIDVRWVDEEDQLDFPDESFDIVINRHESFRVDEIYRVLKPGGYFITQQVGAKNDLDLSLRMKEDFVPEFWENELEYVLPKFERGGFQILRSKEEYTPIKFFDTGAFVYFAKNIEWEFPDFSVENKITQLMKMEKEISSRGFVQGMEQRYLVVARKKD